MNSSKCFSVLADVATNEQLSICVRYVDDEAILHEDFLQFFEITSLIGSDLASSILNGEYQINLNSIYLGSTTTMQIICFNFTEGLSKCGINCDFLYGQRYNGASNMTGKCNGVQAVIKAKYTKALYIYCVAHSFNLVICTSSDIKSIWYCLGMYVWLYVFFNTPKRQNDLLNEIEQPDSIPSSNARTLKRQCATRWIQK